MSLLSLMSFSLIAGSMSPPPASSTAAAAAGAGDLREKQAKAAVSLFNVEVICQSQVPQRSRHSASCCPPAAASRLAGTSRSFSPVITDLWLQDGVEKMHSLFHGRRREGDVCVISSSFDPNHRSQPIHLGCRSCCRVALLSRSCVHPVSPRLVLHIANEQAREVQGKRSRSAAFDFCKSHTHTRARHLTPRLPFSPDSK